MIGEYTVTHNGIYDLNGKQIYIEEIIAEHVKNGGNVSKTFEDRTIYKIESNGNIVRERTACEVFTFE